MDTLLYDGLFTVKKAHPQKVMNFLNELGKGGTSQDNAFGLGLLESKSEGMAAAEILRLRETIKKLEAEKEAGLAQFYKLLKKATYLESRVVSTEEESGVLKGNASKNEDDKLSCLQKKLLEAEGEAKKAGERVREAEEEIERLKDKVAKLEEEREQEVSFVLEKLGSKENMIDEKFSLEIEKGVVLDFLEGVVFEAVQLLRKNVVLENEKEFFNSKVKELRDLVECLKYDLRQTLDGNEFMVLEKSVLLWMFGELKMEAAEAEEERRVLKENFNDASRKILVLETETGNLNEILRQKENERNQHEEKLKLKLENLNAEFSEVRESYQNLQIRMAKVVQENMVLRNDFKELRQQNFALFEDLVHQREFQLHEAEPNHVATQNKKLLREKSFEVLNYKETLSQDERKYSEALKVELLKETIMLDKIASVENMKRFSSPGDLDNEIKCDLHKLGCSLDDQCMCTNQHSTQQMSYIGLKMAAPQWGLKIEKSPSKTSSVNSDAQKETFFDQISRQALEKKERTREKKHRGLMIDLGKKLHLENYFPMIKKKEKLPAWKQIRDQPWRTT